MARNRLDSTSRTRTPSMTCGIATPLFPRTKNTTSAASVAESKLRPILTPWTPRYFISSDARPCAPCVLFHIPQYSDLASECQSEILKLSHKHFQRTEQLKLMANSVNREYGHYRRPVGGSRTVVSSEATADGRGRPWQDTRAVLKRGSAAGC
jgi:hypothetical protein